jgi:choline dehydrogenase
MAVPRLYSKVGNKFLGIGGGAAIGCDENNRRLGTGLDRYDYIVVGGGSSGCVTTSRLVREFGARVLLLEAGPRDGHRLIDMPAGFVKFLFRPSPFMSVYETEPQPSLGGRTLTLMQGHVLGGGSSVNAMTYTRGVPADYAKWDAASGHAGWDWATLLPYFRKHEGNQRLNTQAHGVDGPLKVSDPHHPLCDASRVFLHAMQDLGVDYSTDVNSGNEEGVNIVQTTTYKGRRCSATRAFLDPVRADPRLTLKCNTAVTRVLFEKGRAVGVEFVEAGGRGTARAYAANEVILTAGAYASPKLLMLSGIGPAAHLAEMGIESRVDLPGVGQNMQDHNCAFLVASADTACGYFGEDRGLRMLINGLQYLWFGSGPVASNASEVMAFVRTSEATGAEPDLQIYCMPVMTPTPLLSPPPAHGITLMANLITPQSRGSLRLRSADPADKPIIAPNYLSDPRDLRTLIAGMRYARAIVETVPMSRLVKEVLGPEPTIKSDADLGAYCKAVTSTNYHPVGSCRMGLDSDPSAVLTPHLKVRGVEGLRVFDASMMPNIISANTNAPVMAVADRAVDLMMRRVA